MSIQFRVALLEEKDKVLQFLRESYYPEEPLTVGNEPHQQTYEDEEFTMSNLQYGTCIIAVEIFSDPYAVSNECICNEKIIGAAIAGPKYPNEANHIMEMVEQCKTAKWITLLKLFAALEEKADVFRRYNVTKAVHVHALAVSAKSRGKSIGAKLMEKCMEIAKELGFQLLTADCTSIYSIRLAEKLNMDCVSTTAFGDYLDQNGKQIFKPPQPHTQIKTFAKLLK